MMSDGPKCGDPAGVAAAWDQLALVLARSRRLERLVQGSKGETHSAAAVSATKDNMVFNGPILQALALDMSSRTRMGPDPLETLFEMTTSWYNLHPLYKEMMSAKKLAAWAHGDAWTLHKMLSQLRSPASRYSSCRAPGLYLLSSLVLSSRTLGYCRFGGG